MNSLLTSESALVGITNLVDYARVAVHIAEDLYARKERDAGRKMRDSATKAICAALSWTSGDVVRDDLLPLSDIRGVLARLKALRNLDPTDCL